MDSVLKILGALVIVGGVVACFGMWPGGSGSYATAAKINALSYLFGSLCAGLSMMGLGMLLTKMDRLTVLIKTTGKPTAPTERTGKAAEPAKKREGDWTCSSCGFENRDWYSECFNCGKKP